MATYRIKRSGNGNWLVQAQIAVGKSGRRTVDTYVCKPEHLAEVAEALAKGVGARRDLILQATSVSGKPKGER
jgi:hypothetical protein